MANQPKAGSKRVYVYLDEQQHVQLKVRLDYLGISMTEFVRVCGGALLDQHPIMEQFMDHYRETNPKFSKKNVKQAKKDREESDKLMEDLGLNIDDIENIFDIIEEDHPEI
jgi:succinate dehydrogenase/fumarate reductase flavoprotein subunit